MESISVAQPTLGEDAYKKPHGGDSGTAVTTTMIAGYGVLSALAGEVAKEIQAQVYEGEHQQYFAAIERNSPNI